MNFRKIKLNLCKTTFQINIEIQNKSLIEISMDMS